MEAFQFGRAFQYQFQDQNWMKKVLILAVCPFIPLVGAFVVFGHGIKIMRHVADGNEGLPEWDSFGQDILNGLQAFVIALVYLIPSGIVYFGSMIVGLIIAGVAGSNPGDPANAGDTIAGLAMMAGMLLAMAFFFGGMLMIPVGIARFADKGSIGAALNPKGVFGMLFRNLVPVLMTIVVGFCANFIGMLGIVACFVGVYATMAYASTIRAHAWGQVIRIARQRENAVEFGQQPELAGAY